MRNWMVMVLCLLSFSVFSEPSSILDADSYRKALELFSPNKALHDFTPQPVETLLHPNESEDALDIQGLGAIQHNETLTEVYMNQRTRPKAMENPESPEMQYAEKLAANAEGENCYQPEPSCHTISNNRTCEVYFNATKAACGKRLQVHTRTQTHRFTRKIVGLGLQQPFLLTHCDTSPHALACSYENELHLSTACHSLSVHVTWKGEPIETSQDQTCTSPLLTVFSNIKASTPALDIVVDERIIEDAWEEESCEALQKEVTEGRCFFDKGETCIDANATKWINGYPVERACWGSEREYQCTVKSNDTCIPLLQEGCVQSSATCEESAFGICLRYIATFACQKTVCEPSEPICMPKVDCMDGSCDSTVEEKSDDFGEGVSRLGALMGTAGAIAEKNVPNASVFEGTPVACEKYLLGARNCCSDSGWADWVIDCPENMQLLHRAIEEQRAVYLGDYRDGTFDINHHFVYCLFPTKLARIVQQEGRFWQLKRPFGDAEHPDCKGLTVDELESIDYGLLNLELLEKEYVDRFNPRLIDR